MRGLEFPAVPQMAAHDQGVDGAQNTCGRLGADRGLSK